MSLFVFMEFILLQNKDEIRKQLLKRWGDIFENRRNKY